MRFENIVFVMEDVDAASKVVYRRASGKDKKKSKDRGKGHLATQILLMIEILHRPICTILPKFLGFWQIFVYKVTQGFYPQQ